MGPPGVGKGSLASNLSKFYNIPHISTGAMFREEIQKGNSRWETCSGTNKRWEVC